MDLRRVFDCMISVSELGRGQASKVIQSVEEQDSPYIVVKNNKPQAVIISVNEYIRLMRSKELLEALQSQFSFDSGQKSTASNNNIDPDQYTVPNITLDNNNFLTKDEIDLFLKDEEGD